MVQYSNNGLNYELYLSGIQARAWIVDYFGLNNWVPNRQWPAIIRSDWMFSPFKCQLPNAWLVRISNSLPLYRIWMVGNSDVKPSVASKIIKILGFKLFKNQTKMEKSHKPDRCVQNPMVYNCAQNSNGLPFEYLTPNFLDSNFSGIWMFGFQIVAVVWQE